MFQIINDDILTDGSVQIPLLYDEKYAFPLIKFPGTWSVRYYCEIWNILGTSVSEVAERFIVSDCGTVKFIDYQLYFDGEKWICVQL